MRNSFLRVETFFAPLLQQSRLSSFEDFFHYSQGEIASIHSRRDARRVRIGTISGVLKREYQIAWKDYLDSWRCGFGFVPKSVREWTILHLLRKQEILCPQPIAVGQQGGRAFLLVREIPEAVDLPSYFGEHCSNSPCCRRRLARSLGSSIAHLHAAGFSHPDLFAKHIFLGAQGSVIGFVDFQRSSSYHRISWRRRWRDLATLDFSLAPDLVSRRDRAAGLLSYLRTVSPQHWRRLFKPSVFFIGLRKVCLLKRARSRRKATAYLQSHVMGRYSGCTLPRGSQRLPEKLLFEITEDRPPG